MGAKTSIEWTKGDDGSAGASWNPIQALVAPPASMSERTLIGHHCEHVSKGCIGCYAEGINLRLGTKLAFKAQNRKTPVILLNEEVLRQPLRWRRPRRVFVCSMTDLFGDWVKDEWIAAIFAVMALARQHTFIILTKRPERMRQWLIANQGQLDLVDAAMDRIAPAFWHDRELQDVGGWPLSNVWAGVSAEDQPTADQRIPILLESPAVVRWVSLEPLIGPIDLLSVQRPVGRCWLDWVVVGGASKGMRDVEPPICKVAWVRALQEQCNSAGVDFFLKQWGEWVEFRQVGAFDWLNATPQRPGYKGPTLGRLYDRDALPMFRRRALASRIDDNGEIYVRLGKKKSGALLDGQLRRQFPRRTTSP